MMQFKAIKPTPFNDAAMSTYLREQVKEWARAYLIKQFEALTANWKGEKPIWDVVYKSNQYQIIVSVQPKDPASKGAKKFVWVDKGTEAHVIRPRPENKSGLLVFMVGGAPGSFPYSMKVQEATPGTEQVFATEVHHPGTAARDWTDIIKIQAQAMFEIQMRGAMRDAAKASGHQVK